MTYEDYITLLHICVQVHDLLYAIIVEQYCKYIHTISTIKPASFIESIRFINIFQGIQYFYKHEIRLLFAIEGRNKNTPFDASLEGRREAAPGRLHTEQQGGGNGLGEVRQGGWAQVRETVLRLAQASPREQLFKPIEAPVDTGGTTIVVYILSN